MGGEWKASEFMMAILSTQGCRTTGLSIIAGGRRGGPPVEGAREGRSACLPSSAGDIYATRGSRGDVMSIANYSSTGAALVHATAVIVGDARDRVQAGVLLG